MPPASAPPAGASLAFDRVADEYDATRGLPPGVPEQVAALFVQAGGLAPDARVLEVGIGTGRIALPLAAHVDAVVGVDLSAPMLARLRAKRAGARVWPVRGDATRIPFADARFDAAVAVHVFHLIPGWRDVLRELARVLRPGGALLHGVTGIPSGELVRMFSQRGIEDRGVRADERDRFLAESGWRRDGEPASLPYAQRIDLREVIAMVERRSWSRLWDLPDDAIAALAERAREEIRRRFGRLDQVVELEGRATVERWRPPPAEHPTSPPGERSLPAAGGRGPLPDADTPR